MTLAAELVIMSIMTKTVTVAEAKAQLSECIRAIERGDTVVITRHGKPVAALVPSEVVETLKRLRAAGPGGGLANLAGGWKGSEDLVRRLEQYRRGKPRRVPALD